MRIKQKTNTKKKPSPIHEQIEFLVNDQIIALVLPVLVE